MVRRPEQSRLLTVLSLVSCIIWVMPERKRNRHPRRVALRGLGTGAGRHLRWLLAVAPQDVYDDAIAAVAPLRDGGSFRQLIAASYLMPERHEWAAADLADLPPAYHFVTAYDAVGDEIAPLLARWLEDGRWWPDSRRDAPRTC